MKSKKYITNEIPAINSVFIYDNVKVKSPDIRAIANINSQINSDEDEDININVFAQELKLNINKILEE